ncbi:MAG: hypothetical protein ACJZ02_00410 [Candidatus Neomarinimicrobiota bacterium]
MRANSWYLAMIVSIFVAVMAFIFGTMLFGYETTHQARQVGIFIGLWAPTFGTMGVRAQLAELQLDNSEQGA